MTFLSAIWREVNDVHGKLLQGLLISFIDTKQQEHIKCDGRKPKQHVDTFQFIFFREKKLVKSKIRRSETTVSQRDVVVSEGLSIIGQDAPVSLLPFFFISLSPL
jgi:hypothetical protein